MAFWLISSQCPLWSHIKNSKASPCLTTSTTLKSCSANGAACYRGSKPDESIVIICVTRFCFQIKTKISPVLNAVATLGTPVYRDWRTLHPSAALLRQRHTSSTLHPDQAIRHPKVRTIRSSIPRSESLFEYKSSMIHTLPWKRWTLETQSVFPWIRCIRNSLTEQKVSFKIAWKAYHRQAQSVQVKYRATQIDFCCNLNCCSWCTQTTRRFNSKIASVRGHSNHVPKSS